jgi:hypothetical protein
MEHMNKVLVLTAVLVVMTGARAQAQDTDVQAPASAGVRATRHRDHLDRRIVTTKIGAS